METFQVYSFGSNSDGQLGYATTAKNIGIPALVESLQGRRRVKQIACGASSTYQLLENGECYAWGVLPGALVHSTTSRQIPQLTGKVAKHISCSSSPAMYSTVVLDNGECLLSQLGSDFQPSDKWGSARQVVATGTHFLALLEDGWVVQRDHRLGGLPSTEHQVLPPHHSIIAIAANELYSAALSDTGELYTWGIGPLGHKGASNPIKPKPEKVLGALENKRVISVACGREHMACVTDAGELYTWGSATRNQLGHGEVGAKLAEPQRVQALAGKKIVACSCGDYFSACVSDTGVLYTWGDGSTGALGHGEMTNEPSPRLVEAFKNKTVKSVVCGACHTVCIVLAGINQNQSLLMADLGRICEAEELKGGHTLDEEECFYDVKLRCAREPLKPALRAHKAVLAARCPAWHALLPQQELKTVDAADEEAPSSSSSSSSPAAAADMWELVVDGMEHAVMVEFVRYLYTDRVSPDLEDRLLVLLCVVAERFHLSRLQAKCQAYWEQGVTPANVEAKMALLLDEEQLALAEAAERVKEESEASTLKNSDAPYHLVVFTRLRMACVEFLQQRLLEMEAMTEASGPANPHADAQREQQAVIRQNLDRLRESTGTLEHAQLKSLATDGVDNSAPTTTTATTPPSDKADDVAHHVNDDDDDDDEFIQEMNEPAAEDDELVDYLDEEDYAEVLRQRKAREEKRVRVEKREAQKLRAKRESEDRQEEEATRANHSLGADLGAYVGSARYADIVFEVEDVRIPAHKALLCARSSHFRAMLTSGMREAQSGRIVVPEISSSAFSTVLKYLYTSEADVNEENVIELLIVCNLYSIQQLQEQCENYIESGIQLDNVTELLQMAHQFQTHHLRSVAMNYLVGRLKGDFSKLEGFSELSQDIQDEFKRGIPCPGESLIKAKSGGFQGKRFYFVVISRDFFKKRVLKGEEKWDIVVQFEPHPTDSAATTTTATADQAASNAGSAAGGGDDADKGDDKADDVADKAEAGEGHHDAGAASSSSSSSSGSSSDAMAKLFDFGLHSGTQRGRRPAGRRSHAGGIPLRGRSDKHRTASSPLLPFSAPLGTAPAPAAPATTPTSPASPVSFDTSPAFDTPASPSSPSSFSFLNTTSAASPSSPSSPSSSSSFFTTATTASAAASPSPSSSPSPPSADIGTVLSSLTSTPASLTTALSMSTDQHPTKEPAPSTTGAGFIRGRRRVKKSVSAEVGDAGHAQASAASYFAATATTPATNEEEEDIAAAAAIARRSAGDEEDRPSVLLTSNSDGTYTASFMPYKLGQYSISVSLNGTPIKNSPFRVRFEKPIFSRNCRAAFKGDSGSGVITAGKEATLIIQSRDINNRPITVGGAEPGFRVCVYLPSAKESTVMSSNPSFYFNPARQGLSDKGLTDVYVRDNKDGTYTATFALRRSGDFLVDVVRHEISDKMRLPIFGSPYPIACFPAGAHGPKCEAEGDGLVSAVMGKPASFHIRTFDRYANRRDVGGDTFVVRLIRRGAVPLVRNEEEEREKEEERKREENSKKQNEEKCSPGGMMSLSSSTSSSTSSLSTPLTPEQQQQFEDENIDAAEQRRDDERKNKKQELAERKRKQAEEWRQLDALLQQHELVRGVVTDEGDGTYHATYTVPPDIHDIALRNRAALEAAAAAATTPDATSSSAEATSSGAEATSAAAEAAAEGEGEAWPQEYQLVVTLLDGGMVRDSPFNLLLLHEGFVFDDDHADVGSAHASLLGAAATIGASTPRGLASAENAEPTTPRIAIQRVAGGDDNDAFLRGLKSDESENDDIEDELKSDDSENDDADEKNENGKNKDDESEDDDNDDVQSKRVVRKVMTKKTGPRPRPRTLSFAKPTTITTPPSFSPPTSPRAAPTSTASAPSSPFRLPPSSSSSAPSLLLPATVTTANPAASAPPVPLLPMPALAPAQPSFVPASPGSPFSTEIFSTMFTAHMELMQPDAATFSFSPSGASASFLPPAAALPPPSFSFSSSPAPSSGSSTTTTTATSPFTFAFASADVSSSTSAALRMPSTPPAAFSFGPAPTTATAASLPFFGPPAGGLDGTPADESDGEDSELSSGSKKSRPGSD